MDQQDLSRPNCFCGFEFLESIEKVEIIPDRQPKITHNVVDLINYPRRADQLLPQTLHLLSGRLSDEEKEISLHAAKTVNQYARKMDSCQAIVNSNSLLAALVQATSDGADPETLTEVIGTLHHVSHHSDGVLALFGSGALPPLVRHLASSDETVMFEALVTVHNIIWNQRAHADALCAAGGIKQLLELLRNDDIQLLILVIDCLGMLAGDSPENQASIVAMHGIFDFLRILRTYDEEDLLEITLDLLLILSQDTRDRRAIVFAGGLQTLTSSMVTGGAWPGIVRTCLRIIHRLSDVAEIASAMSYDELYCMLNVLVAILRTNERALMRYAVNTLYILTIHGPFFREMLCLTNGINVLLGTAMRAGTDQDDQIILETAVRILSHLTECNELAELARSAAHFTHSIIRDIVQLLIPATWWPLIETILQLIRNLAYSPANRQPLRRAHAVDFLTQIVQKVRLDLVSNCCLLIFRSKFHCLSRVECKRLRLH